MSEPKELNRAIITVLGHDRVGIIAAVSTRLSETNVNILDISQTILQEFFTMIMVVDLSGCAIAMNDLRDRLAELEEQLQVKITLQHEDIFQFMHRI